MTARLTRTAISNVVTPLGWRLHSGAVYTVILVASLREAALAAGALATVPGGEDHLRLDLRADAVLARVATPETGWVSPADLDLVAALTAEATRLGLTTQPVTGARPAQVIEIGIDALDADAIRPFWRAVLAYVPDPDNPADLIDPYGQGPMVWFQQMDTPRPQRNRIHFDIEVPHDQLQDRLATAVAAGGRVVVDTYAPAFWVLADPEGNEACLCTWQGRD